MTVRYLLKSEPLFLGKLKNHVPKSIFDNGLQRGFLYQENYNGVTTLKNNNGDRFEVETETLLPIYKEVEIFKNSKNPFIILEELLKYGETNELTLHEFSSQIEVENFIKDMEECEKSGSKWYILLHSKFSEPIFISVDL